jgi:hypothetical protein
MLVRAYSKKTNGKKLRIRLERQECPRISLAEAIQEKLNVNLLIFSMNPGVWSKGSNPSTSVFFDLLHEINQKSDLRSIMGRVTFQYLQSEILYVCGYLHLTLKS